MPTDPTFDLRVNFRFSELYLTNLVFTLYRHKYSLIAAVVFLVSIGYLDHNIAIPFYLAVVFALLLPVASWVDAWRVFRDPRTKSGLRYVATRQGVRVEGPAVSADLDWSGFVRAHEMLSAFFLFTTGTTFLRFPKRCFESDDEVARFRELIRSKVPKAKLRSKL